jgi:hypothetical protein
VGINDVMHRMLARDGARENPVHQAWDGGDVAPTHVDTADLIGPTLGDMGRGIDLGQFWGPNRADAKTDGKPDNKTRQLDAIQKLPPNQQSEAIEKLSDAQFRELLATPDAEMLGPLVTAMKATKDPARKLELWGAYHKAHATADARRLASGTDAESKRRNDARSNAAKTTGKEVDASIKFLKDARTAGTPISLAAVDDLIADKDAEHALEMKYNVNFTNAGGRRANGSEVRWKKDELTAIDRGLSRVPEAHLAGNKNLTEIHREEKTYWDAAKTQVVGGKAEGTKLFIPDEVAHGTSRIDEKRQGGDVAKHGEKLTWAEWVTIHELSHNVVGIHGKEYEEYKKINGWQSYAQNTTKLSNAEKRTLDAKRANGWNNRATVDKDGTTYQVDPGSGGYVSRHQGSIPDKGKAVRGDAGFDDPWGYGRIGVHEQFAEHYTRAMHVPEKVYQDLVENPGNDAKAARKALADAKTDADKQAAKQQLKIAEQTAKVRQDSFNLMRDKVFGTGQAQKAAEARLAKRGVDQKKIDAFKQAAVRVSTPDQIAVLEKGIK